MIEHLVLTYNHVDFINDIESGFNIFTWKRYQF